MVDKTEEFLKKHKPMKPEDVQKSFVDAEKARLNYTKNIQEIEDNLTAFLQKEDPMIDPGTGKVIAWVREAPLIELKTYQMEFKTALEGLTPEQAQEKLDKDPALTIKQYELMAALITKPKHDAKWWSEHVTPDVIVLFEAHVSKMMSRAIGETRFFSEPNTDTDLV
jgi:hypothetical protein